MTKMAPIIVLDAIQNKLIEPQISPNQYPSLKLSLRVLFCINQIKRAREIGTKNPNGKGGKLNVNKAEKIRIYFNSCPSINE